MAHTKRHFDLRRHSQIGTGEEVPVPICECRRRSRCHGQNMGRSSHETFDGDKEEHTGLEPGRRMAYDNLVKTPFPKIC